MFIYCKHNLFVKKKPILLMKISMNNQLGTFFVTKAVSQNILILHKIKVNEKVINDADDFFCWN